jgi:methyltransferase (TIGR00027 family)
MALRGVGKTALGMAMVRAGESGRPDRLFDDPYAQAFMDAQPGSFTAEETAGASAGPGTAFARHAVVRTRFYDEYLAGAAAAGCRQVVLLAAGLDTRAFRLTWPAGTRLFELDLPEVLDFKERVLTARGARPGCERAVVPVDLRDDWPGELVAAGFDPTAHTAWLTEGLLIYLTAGEATRLLAGISALSAPDSRLSAEHGPGLSLPTRPALWKGGLGAGTAGWLGEHRWQIRLHERARLAAAYGRPPAAPEPSSGGFLTAVRTGGD